MPREQSPARKAEEEYAGSRAVGGKSFVNALKPAPRRTESGAPIHAGHLAGKICAEAGSGPGFKMESLPSVVDARLLEPRNICYASGDALPRSLEKETDIHFQENARSHIVEIGIRKCRDESIG